MCYNAISGYKLADQTDWNIEKVISDIGNKSLSYLEKMRKEMRTLFVCSFDVLGDCWKWLIGFIAEVLLTIFGNADKRENSDYHSGVDTMKLQVVADERTDD